MKRLSIPVALLLACAGVSQRGEAQWRESPTGVRRELAAAAPRAVGETRHLAETTSARRGRYPRLGTYVLGGVFVGALAGATLGFLLVDDDYCPRACGAVLGVPVGALAGGLVGMGLYPHPRPASSATAEPVPPAPGLARYMLVGAATGGGLGAATLLDRCDDCSTPRRLAQNVPVGAAVGAIGGAVVYGVRHRGGR